MDNMAPGDSRVFSEKGPSLYGDGALNFPTMIDGWGPPAAMGFPKLLGCLRKTSIRGYGGILWWG